MQEEKKAGSDTFFSRHRNKLGLAALLLLFSANTANIPAISGKDTKEVHSSAHISGFPKKNSRKSGPGYISEKSPEPAQPRNNPYTFVTETAEINKERYSRTKTLKDSLLISYSIKKETEKSYLVVFYDSEHNPIGYSKGKIINSHMRPDKYSRFDYLSDAFDEKKGTAAKQGEKTIDTITEKTNIPLGQLEEFYRLRDDFEAGRR